MTPMGVDNSAGVDLGDVIANGTSNRGTVMSQSTEFPCTQAASRDYDRNGEREGACEYRQDVMKTVRSRELEEVCCDRGKAIWSTKTRKS